MSLFLIMMHFVAFCNVDVASIQFSCGENCLAQVDAWCQNSLRIRMIHGSPKVLDDVPGALAGNKLCNRDHETELTRDANERGAPHQLTNGAITVSWSDGWLRFFDNENTDLSNSTAFLSSLAPIANSFTFKPYRPSPTHQYWSIGAEFSSSDNEVVVGLGQHSSVPNGQTRLNQKGFSWSLAIKKFDIMVPFFVSSRRYGFLWNAPGDGKVNVANDSITWNSIAQRQIDFWVTVAPPSENPIASILHRYADATGHAPVLPHYATGFWQSKMRYRTADELADVVVGFQQRRLPVSVLAIDFYSWTKFGDFKFNSTCWPNALDLSAFVRTFGNGTQIVHSTYPWFDPSSENYARAAESNILALDASTGKIAHIGRAKRNAMTDPFSKAAAEFVWAKVKENYFDSGINMFWLDDDEPNTDISGLQFACGIAEHCGALWSNRWVEIFSKGAFAAGVESPVMLSRAGWAGFQTTGAVIWSSDIPPTFESLQIQVRAGLSLAMSGIPWWTTDIGGFKGGNITDPYFRELLVRWYQYGALCPIMRTHGDRIGENPPLPDVGPRWGESAESCNAPSGILSGAPNEPWSFGNDTYKLLRDIIFLREGLRDYISDLAKDASNLGAPPMRPLFFDFPAEPLAWHTDDEFMLGPRYLVAPILAYGARNRSVFFPGVEPEVKWKHYFNGAIYRGGSVALVQAPLASFPLFVKVDERSLPRARFHDNVDVYV